MFKNSIFEELWEKFRAPWCWSFIIHFLVYTIFIGGFGVVAATFQWIFSGARGWSVVENLLTYSIALSVPSLVPILLNAYKYENKSSLMQLMPIITILLPLAATFLSYYFHAKWPSVVCFIIALIVWVIANNDNKQLNDKTYDKEVQDEIKRIHGKNW